MDERPERVWIHPKLKCSLSKLGESINKKAIEETGYPIPRGLPVSSKIASSLLDKLINNKSFIKIEKIEKSLIFNTKISDKIKHPIFLLIFNPNEEIKIDKNLRDKGFINLNLFKKRGIKENEIQFI